MHFPLQVKPADSETRPGKTPFFIDICKIEINHFSHLKLSFICKETYKKTILRPCTTTKSCARNIYINPPLITAAFNYFNCLNYWKPAHNQVMFIQFK